MKEESDVDDLIEMGREFHSFAPLNEKEFCAVASLNVGRDRWSAVAWEIANFVKFVIKDVNIVHRGVR